MRSPILSLALLSLATVSCNKYKNISSPTTQQGLAKSEYWQPTGDNGAKLDQSKIKSQPADVRPLRVLFVGNSIVFRNGMPAMLATLAEGSGLAFRVGELDLRGKTLSDHVKDGDVAQELEKATWDDVVIQENTDVVLAHKDSTIEAATALDQLIKQHGAKTIVFLTWSHSTRSEQEKEQPQISAAVTAIGKAIGARVAPVGEAFATVRKEKPDFDLTESDRKHPNYRGAYLSACVFYGVLFSKSPVGLTGPVGGGLSDAELTYLQTSAWKTIESKTW